MRRKENMIYTIIKRNRKELEGTQILELLSTGFKVSVLHLEGRPTGLRRKPGRAGEQ